MKNSDKQIREEQKAKEKHEKEIAERKKKCMDLFKYSAGSYRCNLNAPHLSANENGKSVASKFYEFTIENPGYLEKLEEASKREFNTKVECANGETFDDNTADKMIYQQMAELFKTISMIVHEQADKCFSEDFIDGYLSFLGEVGFASVGEYKSIFHY